TLMTGPFTGAGISRSVSTLHENITAPPCGIPHVPQTSRRSAFFLHPVGFRPGRAIYTVRGICLPRDSAAGTFAPAASCGDRRMATADPITLWIRSLQDGDRCAVPPLLGHYLRKLVGLARERLRGRPDLAGYEEDVALSAFKSLVLGA